MLNCNRFEGLHNSLSDRKRIKQNIMKRNGRIGFLVAFLVVSIFQSDMLYSQVAVRSLDCESCVIEFDNPSLETKTVELLI